MVAALLCAGIGWVAPAHAGPILTTPAGLAPGTHFRFVFVTDGTRDAMSTTIGDYDTFVNTQAGGATYNGVPISWQAIGSTESVSAINHISGPQTDPVYLSTGTEVATSTTTNTMGLWSGTLLHQIDSDLSGTTISDSVWTGTNSDGSGKAHTALGTPLPTIGLSFRLSSSWTDAAVESQAFPHRLYAISPDLVVPSSVPEPSSWLALGIGLGVTTVIGWSRHRRAQRRQESA
jgi:hypothetical protein